ncbi:MAG TPA: hypothetical protein VEC19_03650 [Usitatibacter sp.]|nr:hypothetical protein [Usitatibacter sp.]
MAAVAGPALALEGILELKSVRDATARGHFLAAIREHGRDGADFTLERLDTLMRVEEHFQALLLYDQIEFLRQPSTLSEADREFGLGVQRICLEAANGFQRFLRNRAAWATTREAMETMYRVTGLALNAVHCFMKWGYFLGEAGRAAPWKQVHALYALADNDGYSQVPFPLHHTQPTFRPSVQSLYLRTLILDLLNSGNLSKLQLEIADGWFSSWCSDYSLDTEYSSRHHLFYVDIASEAGMRLMRRDSHGESMRYVRAEALKSQIDEVQTGLRHGQLFAGHGAGAVFPVEAHAALLATIEKLYHSILAASENRLEERTHFEDREVDVTLGFDRLVRKLRGLPPEAPAVAPRKADSTPFSETIEITPSGLSLHVPEVVIDEEAHDPELERWRVQDLSSKGFGLLVDRGTSDTILLNGLLGVRNHETGGWMVGSVVRKLPNRVRGEMLVGVEVLSFRPIAVEMQHAKRGESTTAIYLPGLDTNGKLDSIIVRTTDFTSDNVFVVRVGGAGYRIKLNRIIRKGADWIKARFEIQAKV